MSEIMITLQQIKDKEPCLSGYRKVLKANGPDLDKPFPVSSILESNNLDDTLWVLRCLPEYDLLWRKFNWWCASQVVDNADSEEAGKCLEIVERYCEGNATDEELVAATWSAAESAAGSAAESAAWSAESAAWSAESAAWSAARTAAKPAELVARLAAQQEKLKQILDNGQWID